MLLLLLAGAGTPAVPAAPFTLGGGPALVMTRAMDVHETAKWQQQLDNDEIALILALL